MEAILAHAVMCARGYIMVLEDPLVATFFGLTAVALGSLVLLRGLDVASGSIKWDGNSLVGALFLALGVFLIGR